MKSDIESNQINLQVLFCPKRKNKHPRNDVLAMLNENVQEIKVRLVLIKYGYYICI